jgi:hypothetical protein
MINKIREIKYGLFNKANLYEEEINKRKEEKKKLCCIMIMIYQKLVYLFSVKFLFVKLCLPP